MKHNDKNVQASLDQAVTDMREQQPEAGTIRAASERVWKNLRQEIAAMMNTSAAVVAVILHRTRAQLRKDFKESARGTP